ncbi:MAG: hypothetical protein IH591_18920 [Bacteroidales bacterium]|nr:hypothetical protein [Bacteroidales bacterium]
MVSPEFTYLFCLDEKRTYSVEVRRRFNDATRYEVLVSQSRHELLNLVRQHRTGRGYRVALLPFADTHDQNDPVRTIAAEIQEVSPDIILILLVTGDSPEELVAKSGIRPYSWVPATNNSVLRIHNSVKKLISEKNLALKTKRIRRVFRILVSFLFAGLLLLIYCRFRFPQYF